MKRLISGLILTLSVFSLLGCSMNSDEGGNESTNKNVTETEVETSSEPAQDFYLCRFFMSKRICFA